jgi:trimethylamine:corrinoid methyltransferase-like protein
VKTELRILSPTERGQVHERTLHLLATRGMRVDTAQGRGILREAGAVVDEETRGVLFPAELVERSITSATKVFALGGRRADWSFALNAGGFSLCADGGSDFLLDRHTGERRAATFQDWLEMTRVLDALDDIGMYWCMIDSGFDWSTPTGMVDYLTHLFGTFGRHVQDSYDTSAVIPWLTRALEIVFGSREEVRRRHPFSFLLTPASPLIIEERYTDAWLAARGYDIPVAVMPMPLMGATAPGSRIGTLVQANCEVLGTLCLVEAADPGVPFIYAPVVASMDPRSGRYSGGAMEHYVMSAAATEMARHYGFPVLASGCGTDHFVPSLQAAYEKAMGALLVTLSWPDLLVGPGMLGGATVMSFEQLVMDVEVFRAARAAHGGITVSDELWLDDAVARVDFGGSFLFERSTRENLRRGEWAVSGFGLHDTLAAWERAGAPTTLEQARDEVERLLASYEPEPLPDDVARGLRELRHEAVAASL